MSHRPRNIGLGSLIHYRFPLTAIASILHRISGLLLFISIPFVLWVLDISLRSSFDFHRVVMHFDAPICTFFIWAFLSALIYHFIAGVKHLLMDIGFFEEKLSGKVASGIVILLAIVLIVLLGWWML